MISNREGTIQVSCLLYVMKHEKLYYYFCFCISEIFLNYGANSNSRLLMLYGFTIYGNPNSSVEIFANADPNDPRFLLKREALLACDIECQSEPFVISQSNPFPHKLLIFLRCT